MPSLNVGKYIRECMDSVLGQSLRETEIICVDAGSTDGTRQILGEYALCDDRIKIIDSPVKSYGYQMNLGLNSAQGEYIGIIETDDYAEPDMFEKLYAAATEKKLDVVKSDFYFYYSEEGKNILFGIPRDIIKKGAFNPLKDFSSPIKQSDFFNIKPSIWSAIYRKDFLAENQIKFNETAGASYQDSGFNFKVWACAERVMCIRDAFLHYRQDNEQSSVNSPSKVFCVCDEYREMAAFIKERFSGDAQRTGMLNALMIRLKYDSYLWNYDRLAPPLNEQFINEVVPELKDDLESGRANKEYFPGYKWNKFVLWTQDAQAFKVELARIRGRSLARRVLDKLKRLFEK